MTEVLTKTMTEVLTQTMTEVECDCAAEADWSFNVGYRMISIAV
jgi:hypothetical protein